MRINTGAVIKLIVYASSLLLLTNWMHYKNTIVSSQQVAICHLYICILSYQLKKGMESHLFYEEIYGSDQEILARV